MSEKKLREEIVNICKVMHGRGLISAGDGNVSVRLDDDRLLITPSGLNKGFLKAKDMAVTDMDGKMLEGDRPPSSEIMMHLKAYELRPDTNAVIHAHPPLAVALTIAGVSLAQPIMPEVVITLGAIPTAPYATPASPQGAEAIKNLVGSHKALLIERHGSLTCGQDLMEAYNHLEKIEHAARVVMAARLMGRAEPLPAAEVEVLTFMGQAAGYLPLDEKK